MDDRWIRGLRTEYESEPFDIADADPDPMTQFSAWFERAVEAALDQPNAMVLATVSPDGVPSSRAVLLKSFDERGLVFFTNLGSRKAEEIADNPWVSLLFVWLPLHRQVRVVGTAAAVPDSEADEYFATRPLDARISAVASPQSSVIPDREWLVRRVEEIATRPGDVTRPEHWGGYRVTPVEFEFWQGRPSRLHDRIRYTLDERGWDRRRLAP